MSISFPSADFAPTLSGYTGQGAFRFWCQKVLPIVYDDSLSYYELLNKVVNYLNNVIADVANVEENIGKLNDSYVDLQNYVNEHMQELVETVNIFTEFVETYFDNLDVQEEINNKLNHMASDGSLSALIEPFVGLTAPDVITEWLNEHITPTTPLVDDTLSISGAAGDAKITGDNCFSANMQKNLLLDSLYRIDIQSDYFLDTSKWVFRSGINETTGANKAATDSCRTNYFQLLSANYSVNITDPDYVFNVYVYSDDNSNAFIYKLKPQMDNSPVVIGPPSINVDYFYRICVKRADGGEFTNDVTDNTSDAYKVIHLVNDNRKLMCDSSFTVDNSPANSKAIGDKIVPYSSTVLFKSNRTYTGYQTENNVRYKFTNGELEVDGTSTDGAGFTLPFIGGGTDSIPSWLVGVKRFYIYIKTKTSNDVPRVRVRVYPSGATLYNSSESGWCDLGIYANNMAGINITYYFTGGTYYNGHIEALVLSAIPNSEITSGNYNRTFRVMQYNIGGYTWGRKEYEDNPLTEAEYQEFLSNYKKIFGEYKPDVLCLQEFSQNFYVEDAENPSITHEYSAQENLFVPMFLSRSISPSSGSHNAIFSQLKGFSWETYNAFIYYPSGHYESNVPYYASRFRIGVTSVDRGNVCFVSGAISPYIDGQNPSADPEYRQNLNIPDPFGMFKEYSLLYLFDHLANEYKAENVVICGDFNVSAVRAYGGPYPAITTGQTINGNTYKAFPNYDGLTAGCSTLFEAITAIAESYGYTVANGGYWGLNDTRVDNSDPTRKSALDNIMLKGGKFANFEVLMDRYNDLSSDHVPLVADINFLF